jgi:hypothetical protein
MTRYLLLPRACTDEIASGDSESRTINVVERSRPLLVKSHRQARRRRESNRISMVLEPTRRLYHL